MELLDNTLHEGDCIEVMRQWADDSIDHCITDPPYNMSKEKGLGWAFSSHVTMNEQWDMFSRDNYLAFTRAWLSEVSRLVRPNGNIFIFGSYHNIYDLGHVMHEMGLRFINSIVWFKPNAQPNITCRTLTESTEHIIWACNADRDKATRWVFNYDVAKRLNGGKQMRNMWTIPYAPARERQFGKHPSQKPIDVIARIILIATRPGDMVLDCFSGSGTTPVVAQNLERRWVAIEKNAEYNQIARLRLNQTDFCVSSELLQTEMECLHRL